MLTYRVLYVEGLGIDDTKQTLLEVVCLPMVGNIREVLGRHA